MSNISSHNQYNTTCDISSASDVISITFHCIIIAIGILGNSLVLIIFRSQQRKKRPTYDLLIWYLSLFDISGTIIVILEVYETLTCYQHWPFGWFGCKTLYTSYYLSINISVCVLLIIAIDRYRCLVTPFKRKFTSNEVHIAVFISVILSILLQWYQFKTLYITTDVVTGNVHCKQDRDLLIYTVPRTLTILLRDIVFIIVFFVTTHKINQKMIERNKRSALIYGMDASKCHKKKVEVKKTVIMITIMGITFGLLVLPLDALDCSMLISRVLPPPYRINIT